MSVLGLLHAVTSARPASRARVWSSAPRAESAPSRVLPILAVVLSLLRRSADTLRPSRLRRPVLVVGGFVALDMAAWDIHRTFGLVAIGLSLWALDRISGAPRA